MALLAFIVLFAAAIDQDAPRTIAFGLYTAGTLAFALIPVWAAIGWALAVRALLKRITVGLGSWALLAILTVGAMVFVGILLRVSDRMRGF